MKSGIDYDCPSDLRMAFSSAGALQVLKQAI
jgi:hypothetical protein